MGTRFLEKGILLPTPSLPRIERAIARESSLNTHVRQSAAVGIPYYLGLGLILRPLRFWGIR